MGKGYNKKFKLVFELKNGNGMVKEFYNNGKSKYEGEYSDGERNGKGKEYDSKTGEIIFEGEYLNGKRWTGKVSNKDGIFQFEIKNGKVKKYYNDGKLKFFSFSMSFSI